MSTDGSSVRENAAPVEQAKAILALNWTGEYTQPGRGTTRTSATYDRFAYLGGR